MTNRGKPRTAWWRSESCIPATGRLELGDATLQLDARIDLNTK